MIDIYTKIINSAWYPAEEVNTSKEVRKDNLWSELYIGKRDRVSLFINYLRVVETNGQIDARPVQTAFPVILFNHGFQMFPLLKAIPFTIKIPNLL